jgi:hypothetical protein
MERDGFALLDTALDSATLDRLISALGETSSAGRRNVACEVPEVGALAACAALHEPVRGEFWPPCFCRSRSPVR